jgi:sec-independent protein translocase protein TatA
MPFISGGHIWLILVLIAVLVIFGPAKLPALGSAFGKTISEFRKSTSEMKDEIARPKDASQPAEVPAERKG